jgi:hypothetical protein
MAIAIAMGPPGRGGTSAFEARPATAGHEGRRLILTRMYGAAVRCKVRVR